MLPSWAEAGRGGRELNGCCYPSGSPKSPWRGGLKRGGWNSWSSLASLWLQHPSDTHRGRVTPDTETHTRTHTRTCTHTHQKAPRLRWREESTFQSGAGGVGGITYQREEENDRAECHMLPVLIPCSTAHPPTGLGQASAPALEPRLPYL